MRRRALASLLFLAFLFSCAGCWDYKEINSLAIVTALGVDVPENPRDVKASILIALPSGGGGGGGAGAGGGTGSGPPALMESAEGASLGQTFPRFGAFTGRQPILSHVRVLVIGEKMAREGLEPVLDVLTRWHEFRRTMVVLVARPDAEKCLDIESPLSKDPTNFLLGEARSVALGGAGPIRFQELLDGIQSARREAVVPLIEPASGPHLHVGGPAEGGTDGGGGGGDGGGAGKGTRTPAIRVAGMAVFRRDRMVGTLDPAETVNWVLLTGRLKEAFVTVPDPRRPGHHIMLVYTGVQRRVRTQRGARPLVQVDLRITASVEEVESGADYAAPRQRDRLETTAEQMIQRNLERLVHRAQTEFRSDIFGFGDFFVGKFLYWDDWIHYQWLRKQFPKADFRINVRLNIIRPGTTLQPIRPTQVNRPPFTVEATVESEEKRSSQ